MPGMPMPMGSMPMGHMGVPPPGMGLPGMPLPGMGAPMGMMMQPGMIPGAPLHPPPTEGKKSNFS